MMASSVATQLFALVTSVIVARLLSPRDVGLAAEAVVFVGLALVVADFGVAAVLVQRPTLVEPDISTAFWGGVALGVALTLTGVALSWPIASLFGQPRVQPLFAVLSFSPLLTGPGIVQGALLTRELKFRSLELRTIVATLISCSTGIVLAALGFGPWAIVAQNLVIAGASTVLLWRSSSWRPRFVVSIASLKDMAGFTGHVFGSRTLTWANTNVDNLLVGRFLGPASLGAYSIAYSLAVTPARRIAEPIGQVLFPAFSRMREPGRVAAGWLRAVRPVALVVVPLMLGLMAVAQEFVAVVFGAKWHAAAPVLRLLAPIGLLEALTALNFAVLVAIARTRLLFRSTAAISILSVVSLACGLPWGIDGVATAYLVVSAVVYPLFLLLTVRALGITIWAWLRSVAGVLEAGFGMLVVVVATREALRAAHVPAGERLAVLVLAGAITYVALVAWRARDVITDLRSLLLTRGRDTQAQADERSEPQLEASG